MTSYDYMDLKLAMKRLLHMMSCILLIGVLVFVRLRYGFWHVDDAFIQFIGKDNRSLLEHFFGASAVVYFFALVCSAGRASKPLDGFAKWAFLDHSVLLCAVGLVFAYGISSYMFEYNQAYVSVYGHGARGYFQYDQWFMDIAGALMACVFANRFDVRHRVFVKKAV